MTDLHPRARGRLRVWDLPVRLFHWAIVVLVAAAWWTAEERMLDWHRLAGYSILALVLFRLLWGLAGSTTARFSSFVRGPGAVAGYLRHEMFGKGAPSRAGHNPLGGWSVVVMLSALFLQTALGMFAVDIDGLESGPLSYLVDFDTGRLAAQAHEIVFNILLALIALHVVAVLYYLAVKRDNLVSAMLGGFRRWHGEEPALRFAPLHRALLLAAASAGAVWALVRFIGQV